MVSVAERILMQTPILDSRGESRGVIWELLNDKFFVSLFDHYGRNRVGITQERDEIGVMLYDDFQKPRLYLTIKNGRPQVIVYGANGKSIYSLFSAQGQGDLPPAPNPFS